MRRLADQSGWVPVLGIILLCLFALIAGGLGWSVYQAIDGDLSAAPAKSVTNSDYATEVRRDKPVATGAAHTLPAPKLSSFALELWARWDDGDDWGALASAGSWYYGPVAVLASEDGDKHLINLYFQGRVVARGGAELGGGFHHLVVNYGNGRAQMFVDGRSIATAIATVKGKSLPLTLGRSVGGGVPSYDWPGELKRAALYAAPLSPKRVRAHYAAGK